VLRHLEPLSAADKSRLREFAQAHAGVQWWLQAKGPETVALLDDPSLRQAQDGRGSGRTDQLAYALPEFGVTMPFRPTDFTQVNPHINRVLVAKALKLLDVQKTERVIDWFCGLGNFTLPLATQAREVLGVEGADTLVARARDNAASNRALALENIAWGATEFVARNLFEMTPDMLVQDGTADKWLVDPPREGAFALVKALADVRRALRPYLPQAAAGQAADDAADEASHAAPDEAAEAAEAEAAAREHQRLAGLAANWQAPRRIVYVSCNPATLARDAGVLVHLAGYRCAFAGAVNMFPHTAHVESIAVFERVDA
jgi:23S rRNA (uracil1939-C5)-methyltransferase